MFTLNPCLVFKTSESKLYFFKSWRNGIFPMLLISSYLYFDCKLVAYEITSLESNGVIEVSSK